MDELTYYYCKDCNTAVDTRAGLCACNPPKKFNKARKPHPTYTKDEIEDMIQQRFKELEGNMEANSNQIDANESGVLVCPRCGKRYDQDQSICTCGMFLTYGDVNEVLDKVTESQRERIEEPTWKLELYRYVNGRREKAQIDIKMDGTKFYLGRKEIQARQIFPEGSIQKVSRYSAILVVEDGRLYIQHDYDVHPGKSSGQKSKIYVNDTLLEENQRRIISEGDCIVLGKAIHKSMDFNLEIVVKRIQSEPEMVQHESSWTPQFETFAQKILNQVESIKNKLNENADQVSEIGEKLDHNTEVTRQTLHNTNEIKGSVTELCSIQSENFKNVNTYLKALKQFENKYLDENKDKTADDYLKIFLKDTPNAEEFVSSLNEIQLYYLKSAAVVDVSATEHKVEGVDYSGIFMYLAKMVENYLNNTLISFMEKYFFVVWESVKKNGSSHPTYNEEGEYVGISYTIGVFIKALERDNNYVEKNPWTDKYKKIAKEANVKGIDKERVKKAFAMFESIYGIRNDSAHSVLEEVMSDKVVKVDYDKYLEAKKQILQTTALLDISKCYKAIFEDK